MDTQPEPTVKDETTTSKEQGRLFEAARMVLLAGIGAIALTQDEIEKIVNKLVERGEMAERDGQKLVREMFEKRKARGAETEDQLSSRIQEFMDRMNIPTKTDIQKLSDKITALTKKVEKMKGEQSS